ncbi:heme peroxidase [Meira miltonrushii]|uniref:Peroxidase n=1 Tax=Meira miltonrushii TaxID=1280837 RepID=A0A316VE89_9BASI|nr:heme peroxidase [Meira miltonrushii]PWN35876.1 heme peroxidase [Meira miltonrushii]
MASAIRATMPMRMRANVGTTAIRRTAGSQVRMSAPKPCRAYSTSPQGGNSGGSPASGNNVIIGVGVLAAAGLGFYFYNQEGKKDILGVGAGRAENKLTGSKGKANPANGIGSFQDYQQVYNDIADRLEHNPEYDDGSYGPVLVRLAWHASGTYNKEDKSGGSNGATMRFAPEANHGANAGLLAARDFLEPIHAKHPWITYSDLWTLGGVAAVQEMGGPKISWRPGRSDKEQEHCTPDGRLPDGDKGSDHIRFIFYRMGFNDQEIVALSGAHALGRCHTDRSGFEGPWTHSPISFTNEYYNLLFNEKWSFRKWGGPKQYQDKSTGGLMMLTTDMALVQDSSFRKYANQYAESEDKFFEDFSKAYAKLLELGVPEENFKKFETALDGGRPFQFKSTAEQEIEQSKK